MEKGSQLSFGAIECLINYQKTNEDASLTELEVADYESGEMIPAESAYYLKSKGIPSPMGANLSAFSNGDLAAEMATGRGGEVHSWEAIVERFQ